MGTFSDRHERADEREQARESVPATIEQDAGHWRERALVAERALRSDHGRVVVIRGEWRPRVDRVHGYVRLEIENGACAMLDPDAVRLACLAGGVELKR